MRARPDPTPLEIRDRCRQVQRKWSRRERWKRAGKPPRLTCPVVRVSDFSAAISDECRQDQENER